MAEHKGRNSRLATDMAWAGEGKVKIQSSGLGDVGEQEGELGRGGEGEREEVGDSRNQRRGQLWRSIESPMVHFQA